MKKRRKVFDLTVVLVLILLLAHTAIATTVECNHESFYSYERVRYEYIDSNTHSVIVEVVSRCPDCLCDISIAPFETYTAPHTNKLTNNYHAGKRHFYEYSCHYCDGASRIEVYSCDGPPCEVILQSLKIQEVQQ